jgi:hypothetical protein
MTGQFGTQFQVQRNGHEPFLKLFNDSFTPLNAEINNKKLIK